VPLRLDALSYRLSGVKLEAVREDHWTQALDARLEQLAAVWEQLDQKYAAVKERLGPAAPAVSVPAQAAEAR